MRTFVLLLALLFIAGCTGQNERSEYSSSKEDVTLTTEDGITIKGTLYNSESSKGVILLHMLNKDRSSWDRFAAELQAKYKVVAIDLRGHGDSDLDWKTFTDDDFSRMVMDVKATAEYLGVKDIAVVGASIGANVALRYAADEPVSTLVLLSPGLDYRGVETEDAAGRYANPVLIAVSENDAYAYESSLKLYGRFSGKKELKILKGRAHGTDMLGEIWPVVSEWLNDNL